MIKSILPFRCSINEKNISSSFSVVICILRKNTFSYFMNDGTYPIFKGIYSL